MKMRITIDRDGVWAGDGRLLDDGAIVDCAAQLGADSDASDETYEAIEDAITEGRESIERPDGTYSWSIVRDDARPTEMLSTRQLLFWATTITRGTRGWSQSQRDGYCDGELADIVAELTARGYDDVWPRWVETGIWTLDGE